MLRQVDVLWVVELGIGGVEDGMDHPGLQVQQHSPGDVMLIICLSKGSQGGPNELGRLKSSILPTLVPAGPPSRQLFCSHLTSEFPSTR